MLHRRHTESLADRIDQLMIDVLVSDDGERIPRLAEHLTPDFVYITPSAVEEGAQGLSEAYSRFRREAWRKTSLRRTSGVDLHHSYFRFDWEQWEGTRVVLRGCCFGSVDGEGKISRIVLFDEPDPAQD